MTDFLNNVLFLSGLVADVWALWIALLFAHVLGLTLRSVIKYLKEYLAK